MKIIYIYSMYLSENTSKGQTPGTILMDDGSSDADSSTGVTIRGVSLILLPSEGVKSPPPQKKQFFEGVNRRL